MVALLHGQRWIATRDGAIQAPSLLPDRSSLRHFSDGSPGHPRMRDLDSTSPQYKLGHPRSQLQVCWGWMERGYLPSGEPRRWATPSSAFEAKDALRPTYRLCTMPMPKKMLSESPADVIRIGQAQPKLSSRLWQRRPAACRAGH